MSGKTARRIRWLCSRFRGFVSYFRARLTKPPASKLIEPALQPAQASSKPCTIYVPSMYHQKPIKAKYMTTISICISIAIDRAF